MNKPRNQALQPRLPLKASVKIIGLGGVGSIVARYGAVFLASLGQDVRLVLIDGDSFEPGNATRMFFGSCGNKATVVRTELAPCFLHTRLTVVPVESYLTRRNIKRLIQPGDIVLLCVDNNKTRRLVDRHCEKLKDICLISGGNDGVGQDSGGHARRGTYGNVQVVVKRKGKALTPTLSAYHVEIQHPADKLPNELNCTELVVSTPQILFANLAAASAILNALLLHLSGVLHYAELSFDIAEGLSRPTIKIN